VTKRDLALIKEFYVEGNGKAPIKSLRHLTYRDMKGITNTTAMVFEYTYLETIEPGALRDQRLVSNMEISHSRISDLDGNAFCGTIDGVKYGLPSLKTVDMDSNRPFKNGTVHVDLLRCLKNLESADFDTDFITTLPDGLFRGNPKLNHLDLKNNKLSARTLRYVKSVASEVELGEDKDDVMESWQIPERI